MATITALLQDAKAGAAGAMDRLFAHVYDDLRQVARGHLRRRSGFLQATALVNAAFERLAAKEALTAEDRRQFFFVLSRAMHDVLVEQVRAKLARKRGGGARRVPLVEIAADGETRLIDVLDLEEAIAELGSTDPQAAQVVMLRFYSELTLEETSEAIGLTFAVTRRHWEYAKAWLHERLSRGRSDST